MKKQILYMLCATALLSSCHIYKSYDRPEDITTSGLYRDPVADNDTLVSDTANFGNLPCRPREPTARTFTCLRPIRTSNPEQRLTEVLQLQ